MTLSVTNRGRSAMPTGLGFHPYFLKGSATPIMAFEGRWETDDHCLPIQWSSLKTQPHWLDKYMIDTVFTGRRCDLGIDYPWGSVKLHPSANLPFTVIYTPPDEDFFCIEPVSHSTDAINRAPQEMVMIAPGERMIASLGVSVSPS
jgi:aldose 1-epimerase